MTDEALPAGEGAPAPFRFTTPRDGLICGYRFEPGGAGQPIESLEQAIDCLQPARRDDGFVWLHMNLSHAGTLLWLRAHAGLAESFFEALDEGSRSTRIERDGDALYAVVNDVTFDFKFDAADVATLWVGVQQRLVVTARRHPAARGGPAAHGGQARRAAGLQRGPARPPAARPGRRAAAHRALDGGAHRRHRGRASIAQRKRPTGTQH